MPALPGDAPVKPAIRSRAAAARAGQVRGARVQPSHVPASRIHDSRIHDSPVHDLRAHDLRSDDSIDRAGPSAVDTRADTSLAASKLSLTMEKDNFGNFLRRARESRDMPLAEVAQKTKIARSILALLEKGDLDDLPTGVYARGFIRSFARAVGSDENQPLLLYERAVEARSAAEKTRSATPVPEPPPELAAGATEDESQAPRRALGLAVFVIILLLIATITLSLLLRRPPQSGEGLSLVPTAPLPVSSARLSAGAPGNLSGHSSEALADTTAALIS